METSRERARVVAVIGAGSCDAATADRAWKVGRLLAEAGYDAATIKRLKEQGVY